MISCLGCMRSLTLTLDLVSDLDLISDLNTWSDQWPQTLTWSVTSTLDLISDLDTWSDQWPRPLIWSVTSTLDLISDLKPWPDQWPRPSDQTQHTTQTTWQMLRYEVRLGILVFLAWIFCCIFTASFYTRVDGLVWQAEWWNTSTLGRLLLFLNSTSAITKLSVKTLEYIH